MAGLNSTQAEEVQRMIGAATNERITNLERVQMDLRETTEKVVVELKAKLEEATSKLAAADANYSKFEASATAATAQLAAAAAKAQEAMDTATNKIASWTTRRRSCIR